MRVSVVGPPSRPLRILVVDDEDKLSALMAGMLRRDGHRTTTASSGEEALALLGDEPYDVVISDVSMGDGMNGWELTAEMATPDPGDSGHPRPASGPDRG